MTTQLDKLATDTPEQDVSTPTTVVVPTTQQHYDHRKEPDYKEIQLELFETIEIAVNKK